MADQDDPSDITTLQNEIEESQGRIKHLEEEVRELKKKVEYHEENCEPEIEELQKEIGRLKEEIGRLQKEKEMFEQRIQALELSEDELIIRQLCTIVQQNILMIVLQGYFNKKQNNSIQDMEDYIRTQIKDKDKRKEKRMRDEARQRWEELQEEIDWDNYLIRQFWFLKKGGNDAAHPNLNEEDIEKAKTNLKEKEMLGPVHIETIETLKEIWKKTNSKLPPNDPRPRTSSAEGRDRGGRPTWNLPATGQSQGTYASKAAGGHRDIHTKA